ncbi:MAG: ribokinase [Lachnospiraceae bacterium]|jgi:ribokinase|nr:ribokinase [Lachnospiraceae bacterium]
MAGKVVVFGSFVVDLMARIPHLPVPGETVKGPMFKMGPGGKGFNQGAAAHKAGADVTIVTKIGKDSFGDIALHTMDELGMTKEHVFISEEDKTGIALILVDENTSQNEIAIVSGACGTITEKDTNSVKELIRESEYILLQLEVNQDANERIAEYACENGVKVIINTAPYSKISDEFLSKAYMVTPNEVEAEALTGIKVEDLESAKKAATIFKKKGVKKVLITLGEKGVFISDDDKDEILPAFHVNAVDTTGAGDAFNGGFITALAEGKDEWEAAKFANAAAALSVQKLGTTPSMPARKEIDEFLSTHA